MLKIAYITKKFQAKAQALIEKANEIITSYEAQGFSLTLRQLYYQFVARDIIPNSIKEYKTLGAIISDARMAGMIDWYSIEDRTRSLAGPTHWDSPSQIIRACASSFKIDKWENQPHRVEVWVEKEALADVIAQATRPLDFDYFSCRGYTSQSEMWKAGRRFERYAEDGQTPIILHFGDHDPSGIDMTRDIQERLETFMGGLKVDRLALNFDQIEQYNPPPNPAKVTDSRAAAYIAEYGTESWELDVLEPSVLTTLIREAVMQFRDEDKWQEKLDEEEHLKEVLKNVSDDWDTIANNYK